MRPIHYPEGTARVVSSRSLPFSYAKKAAEWSFGGPPLQGSFCYDSAAGFREHVGWYASTLDRLLRSEKARAMSSSLIRAEATVAGRAAVCWRDLPLGMLQPSESFVVRNAEQAKRVLPGLRLLRKKYELILSRLTTEQLRSAYFEADIPLDKGKGWPFFLSGNPDYALTMLDLISRARSLSDVDEAMSVLGPIALPFCAIGIRRDEGSTKPQVAWGVTRDGLIRVGERWGPKIRKVSMCPFVYNAWMFGVHGVWTLLNKFLPENPWHVGLALDFAHAARADGQFLFAGDLSTYDDTVSVETRDAVFEELIEPIFGPTLHKRLGLPAHYWRLFREVFEAYRTMPLLLPPRQREQGALLWPSEGRFHSGEVLTAKLGTALNHARNLSRYIELGLPPRWINSGDDQLNAVPREEDAADWVDPSVGFKETVSDELLFLMRDAFAGHGLLARMLSLQKELRSEPTDSLIAALGLASRAHVLGAVGVDSAYASAHPLAGEYLPALKRHPSGRVREAANLAERVPISVLASVASVKPRGPASTDQLWSAIEANADWDNRPGVYTNVQTFLEFGRNRFSKGAELGLLRKSVYTRKRR